ncbi:MAG: restriction endonuclease [Chloroflexi bacterium]|nr:restriction endonuclease [Chloroflexota bacterium]
MPKLTLKNLFKEAKSFSASQSTTPEKALFGVTDGKAVGTFLEHKFRDYLKSRYEFTEGSSASGIDFPELLVDMKVTSIRQPQSSCPFKSARQKIYGLGYSLLVFVYDKFDDNKRKTATLNILRTIFLEADRTADFQMTSGLRQILANYGNRDDIIAFLQDKNLPADELELNNLADEVIANPPAQGFLTISNALQWRLQYSRVIELAGTEKGVHAIYREK